MRLRRAAQRWLGAALLCASGAAAIYRDEAGLIDFQHILLGAPTPGSTFFFQPSASSKATLVYTFSDKGYLGAINPKDGALVWRQQHSTTDTCADQTVVAHLHGANGTNSVISAYGDTVAAWEAATGRMLWAFEDVGCIRSMVMPDIKGATQDPVILMKEGKNTKLFSISTITGLVIWQVVDDETGDVPVVVSAGDTNYYYVSLRSAMISGYKIMVTTVHPGSARPLKESLLDSSSDIKSEDDILYISRRTADPILVWADKGYKNVKINVLGMDEVLTVKVPNNGKQVEKITVHTPDSPLASSYFLVQYATATSHWAEIYNIDKKTKEVKKTHDLPEVEGDGIFASSSLKSHVFFTRLTQGEAVLYFGNTGAELERWPLSPAFKDFQSRSGGAVNLESEVVTRGQSGYAVRASVIFKSNDIALMRNGDLVWTRMESLTGIRAAAWAEGSEPEDLVRELANESDDNPVSAYIHRLVRHLRDLQHLPDWLQTLPSRVIRSVTGAKIGKDGESDDADFGFQKLVVAATEGGHVFSVDTGAHGKINWTTKATTLAPGEQWNVTDIRVAGDRVLVVADHGESVTLELSTGVLMHHKPRDGSSKAAQVMPVSTADGRSLMLPVSEDGTPQLDGTIELKDDTVVVTRTNGGALKGWLLSNKKVRSIWTFTPPEDESIISTAIRPAHDPVASIGRDLGDRSVLYKYLNPNIMLVITADTDESTASVHLLDTVNGQTLYYTQHIGVDASKNVVATMSENWFAYSFYVDPQLTKADDPSEEPMGYMLTMSEMFESPLSNDAGPLEDAANFSSFTGRPYIPHVMSQTHTIPTAISYMTTTSTKQGITPRSILAYCPLRAEIVAIPVPFLTPRNPVGRAPTTSEREEGLNQYAPFLDFNPTWTISHQLELLDIRGMVVAPSLMESTSLLFAFGDLDFFGSRVTPIGAFDILGKGFGKVQLILTIVALAIGTRYLSPMVQRKQINMLWTS